MSSKDCGQFVTTRPCHHILSTPCHYSYRFRLVSISCDPGFFFSIDGHQMTVIEVDGNNVQPLLIDSLEIFAGTYDRIVHLNYADFCPSSSTLFHCCKMTLSILLKVASNDVLIG
jgi:FtsP/CotA-like multicopper oxidase with cupredoxin domain